MKLSRPNKELISFNWHYFLYSTVAEDEEKRTIFVVKHLICLYLIQYMTT